MLASHMVTEPSLFRRFFTEIQIFPQFKIYYVIKYSLCVKLHFSPGRAMSTVSVLTGCLDLIFSTKPFLSVQDAVWTARDYGMPNLNCVDF